MQAIASSGNKTMFIHTYLYWFLAFRVICPFQRGDKSKAIIVPYISLLQSTLQEFKLHNRKIAMTLSFLNIHTFKVSRLT